MAEKYQNLTANYIINRLFKERAFYFNIKFFSHLFKTTSQQASQWFKRLEKKGFIREVEKGKYLLLGFEPERVLAEPFFIATKIVIPSYISFWSALNFYGFTEQIPKTIFIATTKKKKEILFENIRFKYVKISPHKFFGYREERSGELSYLIAEPEKVLIDSLDQSRYAGGIREVFKAIYNAKDEINVEKLLEYAKRFRNKTLNSRLGYLLDLIDVDIQELKPFISQSYVRLDSRKRKSKIWNKKWRVNVNVPRRKLFEFKEVY